MLGFLGSGGGQSTGWVKMATNGPDIGRCGFSHCRSELECSSGILGHGFIRVLSLSFARNGSYFLKSNDYSRNMSLGIKFPSLNSI